MLHNSTGLLDVDWAQTRTKPNKFLAHFSRIATSIWAQMPNKILQKPSCRIGETGGETMVTRGCMVGWFWWGEVRAPGRRVVLRIFRAINNNAIVFVRAPRATSMPFGTWRMKNRWAKLMFGISARVFIHFDAAGFIYLIAFAFHRFHFNFQHSIYLHNLANFTNCFNLKYAVRFS